MSLPWRQEHIRSRLEGWDPSHRDGGDDDVVCADVSSGTGMT